MNSIFYSDQRMIYQIGSLFPTIASSAICRIDENQIIKFEIDFIKRAITKYLDTNNIVKISSLAIELNLRPRLIGVALKELEEEGIIKGI